MRTSIRAIGLATVLGLAVLPMVVQADDEAVAEAITDYMDFATETAGIILADQIDKDVFEAATFFDVRSAVEYKKGHIPGARNIEWRSLPGRIDEIPETGLVVFYCNTGMRSAQVTFAARLMGRENVLVMQGGMEEWQKSAAYKP
ncbi:rhodanese-like domain-containing protein [Alisedimentitalea sp. MJ-SS2]|uniref:rhodanese-like domain-containing protein n=1 Tax=Aliisedimentitalea sp. MJ-SS2 TaxID=3049795 RepID=UPI0029127CBA|nr:rhodanese-like domain-containing protein [Alisedimentitalea sp. MJ-SS2]MDU8928991.1 rhodanese-like domain-containing protein [Alisedimentitalea sp. MJ-SS2]